MPGRYRCILADPPWLFEAYSAAGEAKNAKAHYPCMSDAQLAELPVRDLAHPDGCALTMWATAPKVPAALALLRAWGFSYRSFGAWAKQSSTGNAWAFGTGYCYRSAAEFWLLGVRGEASPMSRSIRNLIVAPVREHSRKPDQMHKNCEELWRGPRCELFGRAQVPGWEVWGNETHRFPAAGEA